MNEINFSIIVAGSNKIGIGNLMRSISLAKYLVKQFENKFFIWFVIEKGQDSIKRILLDNYFTMIKESTNLSMNLNVDEVIKTLHENQTKIALTDLPNINQFQMDRLKENFTIFSFDEHNRLENWGDLVINYNAYSLDWIYKSDSKYFVQLLGPKYFVLREELSLMKPKTYEERTIDLVLTFGGSDPTGLTKIVYNIIKEYIFLKKLQTIIILGPLYDEKNEIEIDKKNKDLVQIFSNPKNYLDIINKTKLILCSAGNTSFESAFLGTPIITVNHNEIQNINAEAWKDLKLVKNLGTVDSFDSTKLLTQLNEFYSNVQEKFNESFIIGKKLVDQYGSERIYNSILSLMKNKSSV